MTVKGRSKKTKNKCLLPYKASTVEMDSQTNLFCLK